MVNAQRKALERLWKDRCTVYHRVKVFLSTPSARRATWASLWALSSKMISIHALREESDSKNRDKISIFL